MTEHPDPLSPGAQHKLHIYALVAAAAGGLVGAAPANAQIIAKQTDIQLTNGDVSFDLDGDGIVDLTLQNKHYRTYNTFWHSGTYQRFKANGPSGGGVIGSGRYAGALTAGLIIGSGRPFKDFDQKPITMATVGFAHCGSSCYVNVVDGPWVTTKNRYLGLKFVFGGETHYGWLRITTLGAVFPAALKAKISGYAYEATANKPIVAGRLNGDDADAVGPDAQTLPGSLSDLARGRR
jgi:hypothetical protein